MIIRALTAALVAAVLVVPTASAASLHPFADSFDGAAGLNDNLKQRQGSGAVTYTVVAGAAQVGRGELSARRGIVRLDAPSTGSTIAATLTPGSDGWSSVVLSESANITGDASDPAVNLGFLVRANGDVQLVQPGHPALTFARFARPRHDGSFRVSLALSGSTVDLSVNGVRRTVALGKAVPTERLWVYLGSAVVDDLRFSEMNSEHLRKRAESLRYFGYHDVEDLREVRGRSNLNLVERPELLRSCAPASCVVETGDAFFDCTAKCVLYPDHAARWQRLAAKVRPDRVAGFSVLDQPFARGASFEDVAVSARLIKQTFPKSSVLLVEAGSAVDALSVPAEVDRVGFFEPCLDYGGLEERMIKLQERVPDKELLLLPEGKPMCAGQTDETIERTTYMYLEMPDYYPRYVGLMVRGGWTGPRTLDAQERAAAKVLGDAR